MIKKNVFTVIGAGRRVRQDVIPVLNDLGFTNNDISIYATREKYIYVRDTRYKVNAIKSLNQKSISEFVYIAIPPLKLSDTLKKVVEIDSNCKIIADTPIIDSKIPIEFKDKRIYVAEDAAYISELLIKKNQILTFNILFLYKSAYSYHGVAFIESILSRIIFHFSVFGLYFAFCKKGIAIVVGKDNYENGNIALNFKTIPFPSLNKLEIELIGGLSDYDSVSYRFLDLKRLGLKILIDNFLKKSNKLISLKQGFNQYRKSKMINLLGEGLKKLIKLIKDNI